MLLQRLEEMDIPDPTDGIYKDKFSSLFVYVGCKWCTEECHCCLGTLLQDSSLVQSLHEVLCWYVSPHSVYITCPKCTIYSIYGLLKGALLALCPPVYPLCIVVSRKAILT